MKPVAALILCVASIVCAAEPRELVELRKTYDGSVEKAVSSLREAYVVKLQRMVESYTKAGRLEEAIAARRELIAVQVAGRWEKGHAEQAKKITIRRDGTALYEEGYIAGTWHPDGNGIRIDWSNKTNWTLKVDSGAKVLTGDPWGRLARVE
ncbi:MAG: hypothetical protein ACR2OZ_19065 [Verrucomicrobiales bacterium]